ncbi:MAG: hypothetical protein K2Y17_06945 [Qipengyuania sp.]|jgi:hypothetical protein|nr:hypothetical protein [Qipengyuania sp.]
MTTKGMLCGAVMMLATASSSAALADDDAYTYTISVTNRTGEVLSVVCNDSTPRPLAVGQTWTFSFTGADGASVECSGYDHHGDVIGYASATLDHHHLSHSMNLVRRI